MSSVRGWGSRGSAQKDSPGSNPRVRNALSRSSANRCSKGASLRKYLVPLPDSGRR